jgi:hypothetical protein
LGRFRQRVGELEARYGSMFSGAGYPRELKPWEKEGVSRNTYYTRRRKAREAAAQLIDAANDGESDGESDP